MKKILLFGILVWAIPSVLADYGPMMGYGMMGGTGMWFYGSIWFVLVTFLFSIIFWSTYRWIIKGQKQDRR